MNQLKSIIQYLLSTDGTSRLSRTPAALNPDTVKIDGRSNHDILQFLYDLSEQIRYYDLNNKPQGDWRPFFDIIRNGEEILSDAGIEELIAVKNDFPPHLALLLAFSGIYSHVRNDLNLISAKRLRYYYEEILGLRRKPAIPDSLHVHFQLVKNADSHLVTRGTLLDAGKTKSGKPLKYVLDSNVLVNHTTIGSLKSVFVDVNKSGSAIVYKTEDARTAKTEGSTSWRPFGTSQLTLPPEARTMEPVWFGWAVASPALFLTEGIRKIHLTFDLKSLSGTSHPGLNLATMIDVEFTSEDGWIRADEIQKAELNPVGDLVPGAEHSFKLEIFALLREDSPAVISHNPSVHNGHYVTRWPLVRIVLKPESCILEIMSQFRAEQISIETDVTNVRNLILQNDQAIQNPDKPILPFGTFPIIGSNFYIGSEEIFSKSVTALDVKLEWQDPPEDFGSYYQGYGNLQVGVLAFLADLELLVSKKWVNQNLEPASRRLFDPVDTSRIKVLRLPQLQMTGQSGNSLKRSPDLSVPGSFRNLLPQGFIRVVLKNPTRNDLGNKPDEAPFEAFGHKTYPVAYTRQAILLSKLENSDTDHILPGQPYTPVLKSVSIDYKTRDVFRPSIPNGIDQYFIQDIFGTAEISKNETAFLVSPQAGRGHLFIGLENVAVPQSVSFLFQLEEGTVEDTETLKMEEIRWSYLAGNRWKNITPGDILEESTGAFQTSGLIRINIGRDATLNHSLMPKGLLWLRASAADHPEGTAGIQALFTGAARATLQLEDPSHILPDVEEHLANPLAPDSITGLVSKNTAIKSVHQPYPSFGGRNGELDHAFYRRASERIRHKNRAVSAWDYDRLVLEAFPDIYKIKTIPHSDSDNKLKPGEVHLVVVPDWRKRLTGNPLQPKTDQHRLQKIAEYIVNHHISPSVNVHVSNPCYETLLVDCKVSFRPGFDPGYFATQLENDIKKFLSPWAYEEGQEIIFGGKIHASEILAYIEGREYTDFVVDFDLFHRHDSGLSEGIGDMQIGQDFLIDRTHESSIASSVNSAGGKTISVDFVVGNPVETAAATRPDAILVSNAFHRIEPLQSGESSCRGVSSIGIGDMIIGIDFVLVS